MTRDQLAAWLLNASRAMREARQGMARGEAGARERYTTAQADADAALQVAERLMVGPVRATPTA